MGAMVVTQRKIRWIFERDERIGLWVQVDGSSQEFFEGDKVRNDGGPPVAGKQTLFERAFNYTKTVKLSDTHLSLLALLSIARTDGTRLEALGLPVPNHEGALPLLGTARFCFSSQSGDRDALFKVIRSHFQKGDDEVVRIVRGTGPWTISLAIPPEDIAFEEGVIEALIARLGGTLGQLDPAVRAYLVELESETGSIDIRGVGRGINAIQTDISTLYTPLLTRMPGAGLGDNERARLTHLAAVLHRYPRLLIEGPAGSGKTTFHRLVACMLARDLLRRPCEDAASWREQYLGLLTSSPPEVPVFARLVVIAAMLSEATLVDARDLLVIALERSSAELGAPVTADTWRRLLTDRPVVLLLDGLDEVTEEAQRKNIWKLLGRTVRDWPNVRVVVTSRPFDIDRLVSLGFAPTRVEPLDRLGIRLFLDRWVDSFKSPPRRYRETLEQAIFGSPIIRELAENPMMLTCLCVLHWNDHDLPHGRAGVYERVLEWLLKARREQRERQGYPQAFAEYAFPALAFAMMNHKGGKKTVIDLAEAADVVEREATERYRREFGKGPAAANILRAWLRWECLWSGIIEEVGWGKLRFRHLTFQEYYAATQLARLSPEEEGIGAWWPIVKQRMADAQWRETMDMFPVCLLRDGPNRVDLLLDRVIGTEDGIRDLMRDALAVSTGGRMLAHLRVPGYDYRPTSTIEDRYTRVVERVMPIFTREGAEQVPWRQRLAVAEALGKGGDPRLVEPPRKRMRDIVGRAAHGTLNVMLGLYPVTVEEYQHFVIRGYEERRYWAEKERAEGWKIKLQEGWEAPRDWGKQLLTPNRSVVGVSWYEASAYCAWLSEQTGEIFRLPTVEEWEAAATDTRGPYPWGDENPTPELANYRESGINEATPVGIYPAGAAPGGHLDMVGNIWEWCVDKVATRSQKFEPDTITGTSCDTSHRIDLSKNASFRALRGGSYWDERGNLGSMDCGSNNAEYRLDSLGFRLALSPVRLPP